MSNVFARAAAKAPVSKKNPTEWIVEDPVTAARISELVVAEAVASEANARVKSLKEQLCDYADTLWVHHLAEQGEEPEKPIVLLNPADHASVTFVVQDRSASAALADDQVEGLHELLGEQAVEELLTVREDFGFDADILGQATADGTSTVREVLGAELDKLATRLRRKGVLSTDQAENFVVASRKRILRPGILARMPEFLGRSAEVLGQFLAVIGKASTRYIKV